MDKSLDQVKEHVSNKYLGRAGIHSVGISPADNAIRLYVDPESENDLENVLEEIEKEAEPYKVVPIRSLRPSIT